MLGILSVSCATMPRTSGRLAMTVEAGLEAFTPQVCQWQLQSKHDIYASINDWRVSHFLCVLRDGTFARAFGSVDEDAYGMVSSSFWFEDDAVDKKYYVDDILFWMEVPYPPKADLLEHRDEAQVAGYIEDIRKAFFREVKNG